jgi:5'-nucleotidase
VKRFLLLLAACTCVAVPPAAAQTILRVIAFNDFHGHLENAAALGALVHRLRAQAPHSVVVSAGDLVGASPLASAMFLDEPTIEVMNRLGLDYAGVGNHEFDRGRAELQRLQRGGCHASSPASCRGAAAGTPQPFEGARFRFLAANVVDNASGRPLFPAYDIREFDGVRVAFVGMTLAGTPTVVTPAGVAGLAFLDEAETVNALAGELREHGVAAIVVVLHEGGAQSGGINACEDMRGPIVDIVRRFDEHVELVVSGHTHRAYVCRLPNASGRLVPVTSAGSNGQLATAIDLEIDPVSRRVRPAAAVNHAVADAQAAPGIAAIVAGYSGLAAQAARRPIGRIAADFPRAAAPGESSLGNLIADAQLAATAAPETGAAVIAFMNQGGIRAELLRAGAPEREVSFGDAYAVQPFGNTLLVKTLTGAQLVELLEQQWSPAQPPYGRILQVSRGFTYRHRFKPLESPRGGRYVCPGSVMLDGLPVQPEQRYRVTMNSFLASGGDGFSTFASGSEPLAAGKDLDALEAYFSRHSPVVAPPGGRITPVADCGLR